MGRRAPFDTRKCTFNATCVVMDELSRLASNSPQQNKDQKYHHHEAQAAARAITPVTAVGPRWKRSQEEQDQDDKQNSTHSDTPFI
jgi:hypothetical protein